MSTVVPQKQKQSFFREVINELKKVHWTSRQELIVSTRVVITATFVFALLIYACDLAIRGTIMGMGTIVRLIFG